MKSFWHAEIDLSTRTPTLSMPRGAKILSVQLIGDDVRLSAVVDPAADLEVRRFALVGDGCEVPDATLQFLGAVFLPRTALHIHVFEFVARTVSAYGDSPVDAEWHPFDPDEEWLSGRVLWLWAPSWKSPRLATGDDDEGGEWHYAYGDKVGARGEELPTHFCLPIRPAPPQLSEGEIAEHRKAVADGGCRHCKGTG